MPKSCFASEGLFLCFHPIFHMGVVRFFWKLGFMVHSTSSQASHVLLLGRGKVSTCFFALGMDQLVVGMFLHKICLFMIVSTDPC